MPPERPNAKIGFSGNVGDRAHLNPEPLVFVVVVAFNDLRILRQCIGSIKRGTHRRLRIIVVDNSLTDVIEKGLPPDPDVDYMRTGSNLGFSRGCNLGIAKSLESGADYTWLLNPDTEVDADCLAELIGTASSHSDTGIVAGCIHYASDPEKLWYAGGDLSYLSGVGKHRKRVEPARTQTAEEVSYATGCCMLVPNAVFRRVGPLKESIFMYLDDAEFCMRIRAAGLRIYYNPFARLSHAVGPGMDFRQYPDYYLYFSIRNKPLVALDRGHRAYLHGFALGLGAVKVLLYGLRPGVRDRIPKLRAILLGVWDSLSGQAREQSRFPRLFHRRS